MEYKTKLNDKEKDIGRKVDEERMILEKNMEVLQLKMAELKENYENQFLLVEEDNHKKWVISYE